MEDDAELLGTDAPFGGAAGCGSVPDQREPDASAVGGTTGLTAPIGDAAGAVPAWAAAGSFGDGPFAADALGGGLAAGGPAPTAGPTN